MRHRRLNRRVDRREVFRSLARYGLLAVTAVVSGKLAVRTVVAGPACLQATPCGRCPQRRACWRPEAVQVHRQGEDRGG